MLIILYSILWYKGNAKIIYGIELKPWQWWLSTGLITNYLGLLSYWFLVNKYNIWVTMAITYSFQTCVHLVLNYVYFQAPNTQQIFGLLLIITGSFLVLK
jgi:uncharacterized membrane protein